MSVFLLAEALKFPPPELADSDGLLAVGGDLSPERLLMAYRMGIFPWYAEDTPILWWSPDPRLVLFPDELKISKSLRRVIARGGFRMTVDQVFREVIQRCAEARRDSDAGTWLVPEMIDAYCRLHELGYAHSVESWHQGSLVGGLYGIALGRVFYGESMFTLKTDASKVALVHLVRMLKDLRFELIDCQVTTSHLKSLGARELPRQEFLTALAAAIEGEDLRPTADQFTAAHLMQISTNL
ncbi:MAG TPA: leucyl/phenylalanyl-tRNA--protein transferase [Syntrophobacteraceae bacterium]|nr:leucyl/phenylalanyl-tRNA--protein transferase [Syntrophobacteraceae bacterium]